MTSAWFLLLIAALISTVVLLMHGSWLFLICLFVQIVAWDRLVVIYNDEKNESNEE